MSGDRMWWVFVWLLVVTSRSEAESVPREGVLDPRIRTATYSSDQVYRLYGFVGYQIDVEFESGETYAGIGGGDLEGLAIGSYENHLILKPKAVNVGTNLTVFTNRRHYQFVYSASTRPPNELTDSVMFAIQFTYPALPTPPGGIPLSPSERMELELARAKASRARNYDYWFCGNPAVKPIATYDDGVHTRITFAPKAELPAIFVRNDDDSESLLNFSLDEGDLVIHRVAARFIVRRGKLTGCIVNKGFVGAGERLKSGTIAPEVKRDRKGVEP